MFRSCTALVFLCFFSCDDHTFHTQIAGHYKISKIGTLDKQIDESSGLALADNDSTFWTHNDGACKTLFKINRLGKILDTLTVMMAFWDWEDITKDDEGYLYLADIGNNANIRKWLYIYKYNPATNFISDTISFCYPDQKSFPPAAKDFNYDSEAVFYFNGYLYLFSKNRGLKKVNIYQIPARKGSHVPKMVDQSSLHSLITSAAINPAKNKFALLTYKYVYIYAIINGKIDFSTLLEKLHIKDGKQMEGLVFIDNDDLLITNENGMIFWVSKKHK